ncbi:MAG: dienelactone hydrolase family protein [Actinomycetota bacterium]|nr:dienelactone hydrolase family protein [Actinomycetota bacterium]
MNRRRDILTHTVEIGLEEGTSMGAYVARPAGSGAWPAVIVAGELFGVSAHVRDVCERLATLGLVALAPDLYHRTAPGIELPHDPEGRARGFELLHRLTRAQALSDVRAAMDYLRAAGSARVGMIGLSLGGHVAYLAATQLDLAAVAVVYGGWIPTTEIALSQPEPTLALTPGITARVLVLVGDADHAIPPEHRRAIADALRASGVRHEVVEYPGASHGFLCDRRDTFEPTAAQDAWRRIEQLLVDELR